MPVQKLHPTIGVCGLDCGLCPRYYTAGVSRCPGCAGPDFADKHPSCSFITCCVKEKGLEVCGQCGEFPCSKFKSEKEYQLGPASPSYPPPVKMLPNLRCIKDNGIEEFLRGQRKRMRLLERMIRGYDAGRSRSFFCRAVALLDPETLASSLSEAKNALRRGRVSTTDRAARAAVLRAILVQRGLMEGIDLAKKKQPL